MENFAALDQFELLAFLDVDFFVRTPLNSVHLAAETFWNILVWFFNTVKS